MNEEKETRNLNEERPEEAGSEPRAGGEVRDPEEVTVQAGIEQTEDSDGKPEPAESADSQELAEQELNPAEPDLPELPGSPDQETAGQLWQIRFCRVQFLFCQFLDRKSVA